MGAGALSGYMDVAQIALYMFWLFFAGLVYYLHRENKREGYPLDSGGRNVRVVGFPDVPEPKSFLRTDGSFAYAPHPETLDTNIAATPTEPWPGAPLQPNNANPMLDCVGPGAYAMREDVPDKIYDGRPLIVPMRAAPEYYVVHEDPDPRGMSVVGADGIVGGKIVDLWVDRAEPLIRFMEAEVEGGRRVLIPLNLTRIEGPDHALRVTVRAINGGHFAAIPATKNPDVVTKLEEEKIYGYFGAGTLYADPSRQESLI